MIALRSDRELLKMRRSGLLVWHALRIAATWVRPGVTTMAVDAQVERFFADQNATPLFKGVPGKVPFPATTCISVNEQIVHGIPSNRVLKPGDIISIDTGCIFDGWCGDAAVTFPVGEITPQVTTLLDVTSKTLDVAVTELPRAKLWSQVARKMESFVKRHQFSVVEKLVGHGIGRTMHEDPQVPNFVCNDLLKRGDFRIQPGLVLAIEPMVTIGSNKIVTEPDHWTIRTVDRSLSAHFEHTIAVTRTGVSILTGPPIYEHEKIDIKPYLFQPT
ncbi:MAG: type I methionyl aminopeptidase [Thermoguttaceae bacterium]